MILLFILLTMVVTATVFRVSLNRLQSRHIIARLLAGLALSALLIGMLVFWISNWNGGNL